MVNEENLWSQKTHETARQSTQIAPEVTGVENGSMFKLHECDGEKKQKNIYIRCEECERM